MVTDYDLRAFDLDFSNSPTLVLTAKAPAPSAKPAGGGEFDYFVTVVARVDINGQAQKIFTSVTDNPHLDAFPRMEIIDALDADANGRGDLLFREHSDKRRQLRSLSRLSVPDGQGLRGRRGDVTLYWSFASRVFT